MSKTFVSDLSSVQFLDASVPVRNVTRQEPLLFRGTVRENLDPSAEYSDAELWQALHRSRLSGPCGTVRGTNSRRGGFFRLDMAIEGNGGNISAGGSICLVQIDQSILMGRSRRP